MCIVNELEMGGSFYGFCSKRCELKSVFMFDYDNYEY